MVIFAVTEASCEVKLNKEYLLVPTKDELRDAYGPFKAAMESIHWANDDQSMLKIAEAPNGQGVNFNGLDIHGMLVNLVDEETCDAKLAKDWLLVYKLAKMDDKKFSKLSTHLEQLGSRKFAICAKRVEEDFVKDKSAGFKREMVLDLFIKHMNNLGQAQLNDFGLYNEAKSLSLPRFHMKKLRKFAQAWNQNDFGVVSAFLKDECDQVKSITGDRFDFINLARAFNAYIPSDLKLLKFNEFHRLFCVSPEADTKLKQKYAKVKAKRMIRTDH